ncbi:MAG: winged helix-turn-helix domain-containing protein [Anaerolineae bacterium]
MQVLLLSQDPDETAVLALALQRTGLTVTRGSDLERALQKDLEPPPDLVVLVSAEASPLSQVRRIRAQTQAALIVITDRVAEAVHILLLDSGVDMVILRPFSARLLIAQVRALLRRTAGLPFFTLPTMSVADLTLDPATRTVQVGERSPRRLTQLEFRLLYTLIVHRGQVLPAEVLVENVWGYAGEGERDLVRGLVSRLRAKVEPEPSHPHYIITVPGVGYSLDPQT